MTTLLVVFYAVQFVLKLLGENNILGIKLFIYLVLTFFLGYGIIHDPYKLWSESTSNDWYKYFRSFTDTTIYIYINCLTMYATSTAPNKQKRIRQLNRKLNTKRSSRQFTMRHLPWFRKTRSYCMKRNPNVKIPNIYEKAIRRSKRIFSTMANSNIVNNTDKVIQLIIVNIYYDAIQAMTQSYRYSKCYFALLRGQCRQINILCTNVCSNYIWKLLKQQGARIYDNIGIHPAMFALNRIYYEIRGIAATGKSYIRKRLQPLSINKWIMVIIYLVLLQFSTTLSTVMAGAGICYSAEEKQEFGYDTLRFDSDSVSIRIDNCCSRTISCSMKDFVADTMMPAANKQIIRGFGNTETIITHTGTIEWNIMDDEGIMQPIRIPNSLYVPEGGVRLLSPQHWAQESSIKSELDNETNQQDIWCTTNRDNIILYWNKGQQKKTITLDKDRSNTAIMWSTTGNNNYVSFYNEIKENELSTMCFATETQDQDDNDEITEHQDDPLTNIDGISNIEDNHEADIIDLHIHDEEESTKMTPTEELLIWHDRLAHLPMRRIQRLAQRGILPKRLSKCNVPVCPACLYGKLTRKPWRTSKQKSPIAPANLKPGELVSVDQIQSNVPGFIAQMKGIPTRQRYKIATVFVDHSSDYTFIFLQRNSSSAETLKAKLEFERLSLSFGVKILRYHTDNGRFVDHAWMNDATAKSQRMSMCGVNAHHQNGVVERRIRQLQDMTRTALLQASILWKDAINTHLWPYAMRKSCEDINTVPHHDKDESPLEKYSGVKMLPNLNNNHPFGCPVFVLDASLQSGKKISKWDARSRMGVYIGPSLQHSSSVGLVLSLSTGNVSPSFHTKYDDKFVTVSKPFGAYVPKSLWQVKSGFKEEPMAAPLSNDPIQDGIQSAASKINRSSNNHTPYEQNTPSSEGDILDIFQPTESTSFEIPDNSVNYNDDQVTIQQPRMETNFDTNNEPTAIDNSQIIESTVRSSPAKPRPPAVKEQITRSGRISKPPQRYQDMYSYESIMEESLDKYYEVFAASSDPDVMYYHEILNAPDKPKFQEAMNKEIDQHNNRKNWVLVPRSDVPDHLSVLPSVWAMRRKRDLSTGEITKWKARLNVDGSKQKYGLDYDETYAPVASWASIRLILLISCLNGWHRRQLDFVQAFPQAPVEKELYIEIPRGCNIGGHYTSQNWVLRVLNNIYGQKQAGKVWYDYLTKGLIDKINFKQSQHDPCILWRGNVILILYTDDTIITGPNVKAIDKAIKDISSLYEITSSDEVADFLGVNIDTNQATGEILLTQKKLIQSILKDLGLAENSNLRTTPAISTKILHAHPESPIFNEHWHYRMIIGKLNYLEKSTRPDIAYAVHQCARFSSDPRTEHAKAVKAIARYLAATKDKGIIFKPNYDGLECYSDADFSGNWLKETAEVDPTTARSRTGYVLKYGGCPLIWASRLQTEIALSSTESEYIALSQSLREVLPMMELITELHTAGFGLNNNTPNVHCKAFEDNNGALEMATVHKLRPRTKHINIKYHHFREAVKDGRISIHKIHTKEQEADIFTKPLDESTFHHIRQLLMGW